MGIADRSLCAWTATFYAALGLTPVVACGGTVVNHEHPDGGNAGAGGAGSGGESSAGGATSRGGRTGSGGVSPGNGGKGEGGAATGGKAGFIPCEKGFGGLSGYEACFGGVLHRPTNTICPYTGPRPDIFPGGGTCTKDSDCNQKPYGFCSQGIQIAGGYCDYGCTKDSECGSGQICLCDVPVGRCVQASCTEDKDCGGGLCASYDPNLGCPSTAFACQTSKDVCLTDNDCPSTQHCTVDGNGARACVPVRCAVGRPFVVDGAALLAPLRERGDFHSALSPDPSAMTDADRHAAAIYWAEVGLMEHASVAAFARFALELLSLGAPPSLLAAAQAAMSDEIAHARDAFALASTYGERDVGPGRLDVSAALVGRTPAEIVRTAVVEGCIGETVAAVAASEALAEATDPAVRAALERVVPDETRHAALAWRFVKWALGEGPRELRAAVASELVGMVDDELRQARRAVARQPEDTSAGQRAHGVLSRRANAEVRARVLVEVVRPCAIALVASVQRRTAAPVAALDMPSR